MVNNEIVLKCILKYILYITFTLVYHPVISIMPLTTPAYLLTPFQPHCSICYSRNSPTFTLSVFLPGMLRYPQSELPYFLQAFGQMSPSQGSIYVLKFQPAPVCLFVPVILEPPTYIKFFVLHTLYNFLTDCII